MPDETELDSSDGSLRGQAVEDFVEVVVDEPVSLMRNLVQCGVRYSLAW